MRSAYCYNPLASLEGARARLRQSSVPVDSCRFTCNSSTSSCARALLSCIVMSAISPRPLFRHPLPCAAPYGDCWPLVLAAIHAFCPLPLPAVVRLTGAGRGVERTCPWTIHRRDHRESAHPGASLPGDKRSSPTGKSDPRVGPRSDDPNYLAGSLTWTMPR